MGVMNTHTVDSVMNRSCLDFIYQRGNTITVSTAITTIIAAS